MSTFFLLFFVNCAYSKAPLPYNEPLLKGIAYLKNRLPDSAVTYFIKAYALGLSKDSLLFLWAEALISKGTLDSALAANYHVNVMKKDKFHLDVLQQRYIIFKSLGWQEKAREVTATMETLPPYLLRKVIPLVDFDISNKYTFQNQRQDTAYIWKSSYFPERDISTYLGTIRMELLWKKQINHRQLAVGIEGYGTNRYTAKEPYVDFFDSLSTSGSVFARFSGVHLLSTNTFFVNRQYNEHILFGNKLECGFAPGGRYNPYYSTGLSINTTNGGKFYDLRNWIHASAQNRINDKVSFKASFLGISLLAQHTDITVTLPITTFYALDARLPYPVFYKDSTYTVMIDTSRSATISGKIALRDKIIASGKKTDYNITFRQPISNISILPKITVSLKGRLVIDIKCSWGFTYFLKPYEWDDISQKVKYLVYSRADNHYYYTPDDINLITSGNDELNLANELRSAKLNHYSLTRIDNSIIPEVSVQLYKGKLGTLNMQSSFTKTVSTLSGKAPVFIQEYTFSVQLNWKLIFKY